MQKGVKMNRNRRYYPLPVTYLRSTLLREPVQVIMKTKRFGGSRPPIPSAEEEKTA